MFIHREHIEQLVSNYWIWKNLIGQQDLCCFPGYGFIFGHYAQSSTAMSVKDVLEFMHVNSVITLYLNPTNDTFMALLCQSYVAGLK